jgi:hypothetical protein
MVMEDGWNRFLQTRMKTMKTLNVTLAALAIVATSGSVALALDGPHNNAATAPAFSDVYTAGNTTPVAVQPIDATSAATLRLNQAGERASQNH